MVFHDVGQQLPPVVAVGYGDGGDGGKPQVLRDVFEMTVVNKLLRQHTVYYFCLLCVQSFSVSCTAAEKAQSAVSFLSLPYRFRNEELEAQVPQAPVQVACHLLVFPPGLLQPLEGDKD